MFLESSPGASAGQGPVTYTILTWLLVKAAYWISVCPTVEPAAVAQKRGCPVSGCESAVPLGQSASLSLVVTVPS